MSQGVLIQLAGRIAALRLSHPVRVAIDGIDAAGKTTFADELARYLVPLGRPVIRASVDSFHRPRAARYRQGADSPEGYYLDSFDYPAVRDALLQPLGPDGTRQYCRAVFDVRADAPLPWHEEEAPANAVLLFDGVFLLRPELDPLWDYRIFLDLPFNVALERATRRDLALFGSAETVEARYRQRYMPGQRLYLETVLPQTRAQAIVDNRDPNARTLLER